MHDAPPHQAVPEAVDDGSLEAAVFRMRHQRGELAQALLARRGGVDLAELGEGPGGRGGAPGGHVAADELHRLRRVDGGEAVGVLQLPTVDEAVVARGALHVDAQEGLGDALRELQLRELPGAHGAAPDDALGEALAVRRGRDELAHEGVVGPVVDEGGVKPAGDLLAAAVDVAGAGVVIAQQVVPEGHPMVGVVDVAREQTTDEALALVRRGVGEERGGLLRRGQESDEVEMGAPQEGGVGGGRRPGQAGLGGPGVQHAVHGMGAALDGGGQFGRARPQRRLIGGLLEGEALVPLQSVGDPGAQLGDLGFAEAGPLGRHALILVRADDDGEHAGREVAGLHHRTALGSLDEVGTGVHRQPALLLVAGVALGAVLAQDGHDLMREVRGLRGDRGEGEEEGGASHGDRLVPCSDRGKPAVFPQEAQRAEKARGAFRRPLVGSGPEVRARTRRRRRPEPRRPAWCR